MAHLRYLMNKRPTAYRKAKFLPYMVQTAILIVLLTLILLGMASPPATVGHIHPATVLLVAAAGLGF